LQERPAIRPLVHPPLPLRRPQHSRSRRSRRVVSRYEVAILNAGCLARAARCSPLPWPSCCRASR
jgi:hypothetical protein